MDHVNENLTSFIYDTDAYEINPFMLREIVKLKLPDLYEKAVKQNYTVIRAYKDGLYEYIQQNIETYIEKIVVVENNHEESQDAIEELLTLIGYDVELSKKIIQSQNTIFATIDDLIKTVDEDNKEVIHEIIDYLIEQNKMEINWKNITRYYDTFDIEDTLFSKIVENIDVLCAEDTEADDEEYQVDKDAKRQPLDVVEGVLTTVELLVYKQEGGKYDGAVHEEDTPEGQ